MKSNTHCGAGQPIYMIGACSDVTRRKESEQALTDSQARLELATRAADLGIWDWDLRTNRIVYSERAKAICGFPLKQDVTLQQIREATHPEDYPRTSLLTRGALDPALREEAPYEYRIQLPDGSSRWVLAHGKAVFELIDGVETATRYVGTIQDITKRHQTDASLRDSESRLRLAIDAGRMAVWEYIVATETIVGSPELNRLLGFPEGYQPSIEEMRAGYYPGEQEKLREAGAAAIAKGDNFFQVEYRYVRKSGGLRWFLLRAEIHLDQGKPSRVVGVVLDITEQRAAVERQKLLINELNHRVKNTLATVQSITAQILRHAPNLTRAQTDIETRLLALSRAHNLLTNSGWEGADIADLIEQIVFPFLIDRSRLQVRGPRVWLAPRLAIDIAMLLQELVTNAIKYGALSAPDGTIALLWALVPTQTDPMLDLKWAEEGGPRVKAPKRPGFGSRLITGLAQQSGGSAELEYRQSGLVAKISLVCRDERERHRTVHEEATLTP
jgi:PAS domain S-box-containing protein